MPYDDWFLRFQLGLPARPEDREAVRRFAPEMFDRHFEYPKSEEMVRRGVLGRTHALGIRARMGSPIALTSAFASLVRSR